MGKRASGFERQRLVHEAARIICEERLTDYRAAKHKAVERLGLGPRAALPANAEIQAAVIEYQRLFGGAGYALRLNQLRRAAVQAMRLLAEFRPRLVGAVACGATHDAHKVQLHGFCDSPEQLDFFLHDRSIPYSTGERRYRYSDGRQEDVPTLSFMAGDVGIDVAIFGELDIRRAPVSPVDGQPMKRLDVAAVQRLLDDAVDAVAEPQQG
jgi:hypothetical protein